MDNKIKYVVAALAAVSFMSSAYFFPAETFVIFTVGWLFLIPAAIIIYLAYGLIAYKNEDKNKIVVTIVPDAMKSIILHETELKREKERFIDKLK